MLWRVAATWLLVVGLASCSGSHAPMPSPRPSTSPATAEFPAAVYPSPLRGGGGSIPACPSPQGVGALPRDTRSQAISYLQQMGRASHEYVLRHTDPAWWSVLKTEWRDLPSSSPSPHASPPILYAGPLPGMPKLGVPRQYRFVQRYCGAVIARNSYAVATGVRSSPALQGVNVFLARGGTVLFYYAYP